VVAEGTVVVDVDVPAELLSATSTRAWSVRPGSPFWLAPVLVPTDWITRNHGSSLLGMAKALEAHGSRAAAVAPDWVATGFVMERVYDAIPTASAALAEVTLALVQGMVVPDDDVYNVCRTSSSAWRPALAASTVCTTSRPWAV
jgi:hypothetical protein